MSFIAHETAVIDEGADIRGGTRIWHWSHVCSGAYVGYNVTIGQNVFIGKNASVGDQCKIQNNVSIFDKVTLERGVFCGPSMVFTITAPAEISAYFPILFPHTIVEFAPKVTPSST